jgi:flagellar hook-associated protein 3 FlgL
MRVTSNSFPERLISQLGDLASRQGKLQAQAATGQRVTLPEDDPRAMRRVLDMQAEGRQISQYSTNIGILQDTANASYSAIKALKTINDKASEIATDADDLSSPEELAAFANQINELLKQAVQTANTIHNGDYLFSGTGGQEPFSKVVDANGNITAVNYTGNTDAPTVEISPGVLSESAPVGANTSGNGGRGLITDSGSGADVFNHLIQLRDHLLAGDTKTIAATDLKNLNKDEENFIYHYGHNGAIQSRLEAALNLSKDQTFSIDQQVSGLVDADLAETMVRLTQVQNAYTAALQTGGNILNTSLLDYLR